MRHLKPTVVIEIHFPVPEVTQSECGTVMLDFIQPLTIRIICFPSHGNAVDSVKFGHKVAVNQALTGKLLHISPSKPFTFKRRINQFGIIIQEGEIMEYVPIRDIVGT